MEQKEEEDDHAAVVSLVVVVEQLIVVESIDIECKLVTYVVLIHAQVAVVDRNSVDIDLSQL